MHGPCDVLVSFCTLTPCAVPCSSGIMVDTTPEQFRVQWTLSFIEVVRHSSTYYTREEGHVLTVTGILLD